MKISEKITEKIRNHSFIKEKQTDETSYNRKILSAELANWKIANAIDESDSFFITRLGSTECAVVNNYLEIQDFKKNSLVKNGINYLKGNRYFFNENLIKNLENASGVFNPNPELIEKFCNLYLDSISESNAIGTWFNEGESRIINSFAQNSELYPLKSLEPYYFENPWSEKLEGKKVLVVHPFIDSIKSQYLRREKLFSKNILPKFDLVTISAVQSIAGNQVEFDTWFHALDYMKNEISKTEFDVAIIGAGAYGLPLGSYIKSIGKKALHIGGATQILFGIKGKRWSSHPYISNLFNDYWVFPNINETPKDSDKVENGCYW